MLKRQADSHMHELRRTGFLIVASVRSTVPNETGSDFNCRRLVQRLAWACKATTQQCKHVLSPS